MKIVKKLNEVFKTSGENDELAKTLGDIIDIVVDYPSKDINFVDVTALLKNAPAFTQVVDEIAFRVNQLKPDCLVAIESRGFLLGSCLAYKTQLPLAIARKPGKLPKEIKTISYTTEYSTDTLEMHLGDIKAGSNCLIVDDIIATGGSINAVAKLLYSHLGASKVSAVAIFSLKQIANCEVDCYPLFDITF